MDRYLAIRPQPVEIADEDYPAGSGYKIIDVALATKDGMSARVRADGLVVPDAECWFYVKIEHPWVRKDGQEDFDEFITDGEIFYTAFRSLGETRMPLNHKIVESIQTAISEFIAKLTT